MITEAGHRPEGITDLALACIDMIGHTGAADTDIRYQDDQQPVVWMAVAHWKSTETGDIYQVGAGFNVERALVKLLKETVDGGQCTHCGRPTGFDPDRPLYTDMGDGGLICWYFYNPQTRKIQGGCQLPDPSPINIQKENRDQSAAQAHQARSTARRAVRHHRRQH